MIDVAKRLTAASFRSREGHLKGATARNMSCRRRRLHSQTIKGGLVYLLKPKWKETSIMKSYTTGQGVGLKSRKRRRVPGQMYFDILLSYRLLVSTSGS